MLESKIESEKSVEVRSEIKKSDFSKSVFFIGSGHAPNKSAVEMIVQIAKVTPDVFYYIAGSCCNQLNMNHIPNNVVLFGFVSNDEAQFLLTNCVIGINPCFEGSGFNTKLVEYMMYSLIILSSTFGLRGMGVNFETADSLEEFVSMINRIFSFSDSQIKKMKIESYAMYKKDFSGIKQTLLLDELILAG